MTIIRAKSETARSYSCLPKSGKNGETSEVTA